MANLMQSLRARLATEKIRAPEESGDAKRPPRPPRAAAIIVALSIAVIVGLSLWYLVQPQPLLVQGEADATRIDIAARVDGRVAERRVHRGENVAAGQVLVTIDNPQLLTRLKEAEAARAVAMADLKRIEVGTRAEVVAARKAALASAEASARLAEQTYDRTKQLTARDFASVAEARRGDREPRRRAPQPSNRPSSPRRGRRRLHGRGARRRPGQRRQGRRRDRHPEGRRWRS